MQLRKKQQFMSIYSDLIYDLASPTRITASHSATVLCNAYRVGYSHTLNNNDAPSVCPVANHFASFRISGLDIRHNSAESVLVIPQNLPTDLLHSAMREHIPVCPANYHGYTRPPTALVDMR